MSDELTSIDSKKWQQVAQSNYDPDGDEELATTLVYTVAKAKGVNPLDHERLPPCTA